MDAELVERVRSIIALVYKFRDDDAKDWQEEAARDIVAAALPAVIEECAELALSLSDNRREIAAAIRALAKE